MRFIRLMRRKAGMELSQNPDASVWLGTFEEHGIEIRGPIHRTSGFLRVPGW